MAALWRDENGPRTLLEANRQAALIGPRVRLAHITSDRDAVQSAFYLISGSPDWRRATYSLLADVKTAVPSISEPYRGRLRPRPPARGRLLLLSIG
jgi:hypothetical protein